MSQGTVFFVGAGSGAADLITVRGARIIAAADIIIWASSLVNPEVIADRRPDALVVDSATASLEDIAPLYERARDEHLMVARVHTGDPSIYGATAEQRALCRRIGVRYESVPGVSAYSALAARAEVEITLPQVAQSLILTRLEGGRTPMPPRESVARFAEHGTTMALYLSAARHRELQEALSQGGYPDDTPVIIGYRVSWPDELIVRCSLGELSATMSAHDLTKHTVVLVGPALTESDPQFRSHLYHPGFAHEYRPAERDAAVELSERGAVAGTPSAPMSQAPTSRSTATTISGATADPDAKKGM